MKKMKYILLLLAMILTLTACGKSATEEAEVAEVPEETDVSEEANVLFGHFSSQTLEGEEVTEEIFANADLTMVNIWGTFCGPCISEMPDLGEIADEYAEKGVRIVGIVSDVTDPENEEAKAIVEETGADYTHIVTDPSMLDGYLAGVQVVPTTVFVNSEGKKVGDIYTGSRSKEEWSGIIDELLEEN